MPAGRSKVHLLCRVTACPLLLLLLTTFVCRQTARAEQPATPYLRTLLQIQGLIEGDRLDDARAALSAALQQYPANGGLENLLGVVDIQQGHAERAEADFSAAIRDSPKLVSAYLNLARLTMQTAGADRSQQNKAKRLYERVVAIDPRNGEALYQEATLSLAQQMYLRSLDSVAKLDAKAQQEARVEALVCADEAALGNREGADRAAASMEKSADLTEQDVITALPALLAAHRADLVDTLFSAESLRSPLSIGGLRSFGLAQEAEGKSVQARETLQRVFAMDSTSAAPLVDLARIALEGRDYKEALGYLAHARALRPEDASLPYEFGIVCLKMDLIGAARRAFGEAVRLAPENPQYNLVLGTLLSSSAGLPYLKKYEALRPDDSFGELALGAAYFQANDFRSALPWLTRAAGSAKTAASARYYLGSILLQQGHYDQAIAKLSSSEGLKPDQPDVLAELGSAYMKKGDYTHAEKELDRAIALDSDNYAANFALVRLYAHTEDPRREQQAKRFAAIRNQDEEQYSEAMRIVDARPKAADTNSP